MLKYIIGAVILTGVAFTTVQGGAETPAVCTIPNAKDSISCTVTKVIDGDTVHAQCSGIDKKIRLTTIDSFESRRNQRAYRQAYEQKLTLEEVVARGKRATEIAKKELTGKTIIVVPPLNEKVDKYNRDLGAIYIDCININEKMLKDHPDVFLKY